MSEAEAAARPDPAGVVDPAMDLAVDLASTPGFTRGGQPVATGTRKALALGLLVLLEPGLRRTRAADLLWPDVDPVAARRNLRRDLFRLRQAGLGITDAPGEALLLPGVRIVWPAPGAWPPRWLDGLDEVAGNELSHWVQQQRHQLHTRWLHALQAQAHALEQAGQGMQALEVWRGLLADGAGGADHAEARTALQRLAHVAHAAHAAPAAGVAGPLVPTGTLASAPARRSTGRQLPFIGRDAELAAIDRALASGRRVLIDGSPGIGKTRLAVQALGRRGGVLVLRCRPEDCAVPHASALRGLQALKDAAPDTALPAWVQADLAPLSGRSDVALPRLQRAYGAALALLADGNFQGWVIDDWQWADPASLALWDTPAPAATPLAATGAGLPATLPCVLVHRSGELPASALQQRRRWLDDGLATAVRLGPLPAGDALALLQQHDTDAGAPDDPALHAAVLARAGGNPLFLAEHLRHARLRGGSAADALPPGVQALVLQRVRALGPVVRQVLEAASLAGDDLAPAWLAAATDLDVLAVAQALEHAEVADLLRADAAGRHRFSHDLLAQAVADSLSPVRRASLHALLAQALVAQGGAPGAVARHFDLAGQPGQAAPWHLAAASVALQRQAWAQALAACQAVLAGSAAPAARCQAHHLAAQALRKLSDLAAATQALAAALPDATRAGPAALIALALERAALQTVAGHADKSLLDLDRLQTDPALAPAQRQRLLMERANALAHLGRFVDAVPALRQLCADLPASAMADRQRALLLLSRSCYWAGLRREARASVEEHRQLCAALGDAAGVATGSYRLGVMDREDGDHASATTHLQAAIDAARSLGEVELLRSALSTLATVRLDAMQLAEAEALLAEGAQAAPHWESPDLADVYDERHCRLHHLRGETSQAWAVIARSLARNRAEGHLHSHLGTLLQAVALALASADTRVARAHLDEAMRLQADAGVTSMQGRALQAHAVHVLQAEGRARAALQAAGDWLAHPEPGQVLDRTWLRVSQAQAALDLGDARLAAEALAGARVLPACPAWLQARLLAARVRLQRCSAAADDTAAADARAWLALPVRPVLEAGLLRQALAG